VPMCEKNTPLRISRDASRRKKRKGLKKGGRTRDRFEGCKRESEETVLEQRVPSYGRKALPEEQLIPGRNHLKEGTAGKITGTGFPA